MNRKRLLLSGLLALASCIISPTVAAADIVLYDVAIAQLYTQSRDGSTAHLIRIDKDIESQCHADRIYIDFEDKELYSAALAFKVSGQRFNIVYTIDSENRLARRHISIPCKLISMF